MFIIVDERDLVTNGYACRFGQEGVASTGFRPVQFKDWVASAGEGDVQAVEAFLIGECPQREEIPRIIRRRSQAPVIAMNDAPSLEQTLGLFSAGVDDVVRKPVHVREILARVHAIRRRAEARPDCAIAGGIQVFFNGGDPLVNGEALPLPRRERRILEYLLVNRGRRLTKAQIFNAVYGLFDDDVEENVIESHISKLRKKLRARLGYDPIDSQRFLGYLLAPQPAPGALTSNLRAAG
ncbi:response regulator transcription factor [Methylocystis parvus]|uniref:Response regulator transcription factor n=1 Tax=Methylocystis parvus TaxID=134 RepID=A0A6B8M2G5_9HYPH|nr:response regulator transcription factor [Methylocystis parvus]QGM97994.1 response regulator transcription factor [Methylocystis parvus]WBK01691.1 response regulator transcription factor [Methylocystis parvus OBBP]